MDAVLLAGCMAVANFLAVVILHLCLCRMIPRIDRLGLLVRLLPVASVLTLATTYIFRESLLAAIRSGFIQGSVMMAALALCSLFVGVLSFYSAITHSVRLRIGMLLSESPGRRQSVESLVTLYDADAATRRRVQQLIDGGYVVEDGDMLRLTRKGAVIATISSRGKRLFKVGLGG